MSISFFSFSSISLIADGPHHYHPVCGHKGSSHLSPVHALQFFLSRCKFSTLTSHQPMVEFYLLTFQRFPLRKKEKKSCFGKNRTHDFRTSRCAAYLLDHSGDDQHRSIIRFSIQNFRFLMPSKKRMVTQSSKPDDHIEGTLDLALICSQADHFPLNSTLDSIVGVAEPSWLRA